MRDLADNLYFDTCAYDPHFLAAAIKQRGVARMVFGTEVPGSGSDMLNPLTGKMADDVLALIDGFDFLTEAEKTHDRPRQSAAGLPAARQEPGAEKGKAARLRPHRLSIQRFVDAFGRDGEMRQPHAHRVVDRVENRRRNAAVAELAALLGAEGTGAGRARDEDRP